MLTQQMLLWTIRALWWWHLSTSESTPMYHTERRSCCQHDNVEQTLSLWRHIGESSWARGGQWDIVRELHGLVLRWCGGAWTWQKLRFSLGYQLLLTSDDGSSSWLLNILWTSTISGEIFHCNGGCQGFLLSLALKKGEFWNRTDYKEISQEVHKVHAESRTQVSSCPLEPKESF